MVNLFVHASFSRASYYCTLHRKITESFNKIFVTASMHSECCSFITSQPSKKAGLEILHSSLTFINPLTSLFVSIKLDPGRQKLRFLLNLQKTLWEWKVTFGQKKHFLKVMICFERPSDSHRVGQIQWKHLTINGKYDRSKTQLNQSHLAEICFILHRMLSLVSF